MPNLIFNSIPLPNVISDLLPERPIGLKLIFPSNDSKLGSSSNSQTIPSIHVSGPNLQWIPQQLDQNPSYSVPVLHYRVEYQLVPSWSVTEREERCAPPAFQEAINQWATLAPVRAPEHRFWFRMPANSSKTESVFSPTDLESCFIKLNLRVRSYSMNAESEPSSTLYISLPLLDKILPALYDTVIWEQRTLRNIADSIALDEPIVETAATISFANGTSSSGTEFSVPENVWFGLSYTLLTFLLLCFITLMVYLARRAFRRASKRSHVPSNYPRRPPVIEEQQEPNKYILTNQIRPTPPISSVESPESPEESFSTYHLTSDAKQILSKSSCFCHGSRPTPTWNNLRRCPAEQHGSPLLTKSEKLRSDFLHEDEQYYMIPVNTMSPQRHTVWTDTHGLRSPTTKTARHPLEQPPFEPVTGKPNGLSIREGVLNSDWAQQLDLLPSNKLSITGTNEAFLGMKSICQSVIKPTHLVSNNPSTYSTLSWVGTLESALSTSVHTGHLESPSSNSQTAYVVLPVNPIDSELKTETLQIAYVPLGTECVSLYTTLNPNNPIQTPSIPLINPVSRTTSAEQGSNINRAIGGQICNTSQDGDNPS
ncbi:unnamed protein product [Echinostoma caproni]|uniref:Protein kinase domain-containing protein n=1 Tax=Echinostoma caproni TaxID=27848 RepID=A0A183ARM5_9TREM|nr:unnamed protein product [Echinostoma caproni]